MQFTTARGPIAPPVPDLATIRGLVSDELESVDRLIVRRLRSDVALVNQVSRYIVHSGGKRLRPLLVLLAARAFGYTGERHVDLAAIVEFIHTATLLHDDVVDESGMRRGRETANAVFGNASSVLVGDFLYSRAFQMMVEVRSMRIMEIMAETTNVIAEGEVMQLLNCHDPDTTEESYLRVIRAKTAKLFEAAAEVGAVVADADPDAVHAAARFGLHLGTAYQLVDDVLDYRGAPGEIGKNVGDDLAEGKPTLPLIHAMRAGSPEQRTVIRAAIERGGLGEIDRVVTAVEATGAIDLTASAAAEEAGHALAALQGVAPSVYRDALETLAEFCVSRTY